MHWISREQYEKLRKDAEVLEKDSYGEKVLKLVDGNFLKLFRRKSWFSKNTFVTPAQRFANNAQALEDLDIPCPKVIGLYRVPNPFRSLVHYVPLEGHTLRALLAGDPSRRAKAFAKLPEFVETLHDTGVYFRSLHLGNIVLTTDDRLGLIDISDLRIYSKPLSKSMRTRNYQHLLRYSDDWESFDESFIKQITKP
ncbi:MAG TPA: toluene tolerance protein [Pseudomonas xinjiangensis]|uniref:Toluene tolerance protein n=2 Tax=root TaxID=1 RepID=A0A7V1BPK8_9GAMM|nr:toluene tolerance protein [Halopseudomonas xinjiangensis]HEC49494.1 toluene tolerance protein [Halopseudomonas xinjiangensis]